MLELLRFLSHIHTQVFYPKSFNNIDLISIQQNETFQIVSNTNNIRNVIIKEYCTFEQLKLFVYLCPRLQQLSIRI